MNVLQRIGLWGDTHHPKWVDFIRIALGIFLFYKGIDFLRNMGSMVGLMQNNKMLFGSFKLIILGHYIVSAHLIGGFLLIIGLFTRFACLIQIPILIGALIFINFSGDTWRPYSEIFLSIVVLLLLIFFLIVGNGPISFNKMVDKQAER
ncbi:MAG TPA: DoxX family protein [Ferruginibacter sp.]|nr:DoxX family protein [Ferruginibacter sp.]